MIDTTANDMPGKRRDMSGSPVSDSAVSGSPVSDSAVPTADRRQRIRRRRMAKDKISTGVVAAGGISVIAALGLMFVYLFSEVVPMLQSASVEAVADYDAPGTSSRESASVTIERYHEIGFRLAQGGTSTFFRPQTGEVIDEVSLPLPEGATVTSFATGEARTRLSMLGLSNGEAVVVRDAYDLTYPDGIQTVVSGLEFPFGEEPVTVDDDGAALSVIGIQEGGRGSTVAAATEDGRLVLVRFDTTTNMLTNEVTVERSAVDLGTVDYTPTHILISADMRDLMVGDQDGVLHHYNIQDFNNVQRQQSVRVISGDEAEVTAMAYLLGTVSVIVGGSDGSVAQWFLVRDEENQRRLQQIRTFDGHDAPVTAIAAEYARKGFATGAEDGTVSIHFSTSGRTLVTEAVTDQPIRSMSFAPRANGLMVVDDTDRVHYYHVNNPHPQTSFSALWELNWYEGRSEPGYIWQSSSATDEFEPKFSLVPLTLGTIKAAFYAMLFAAPLAVMGAVYSAYFMTPKMRSTTKPCIEIMEALPTVILGFLAGLWFAPFVENHLPAVFSILVLMPLAMLVVGYLWSGMPKKLRHAVPDGWEAAILIPVVLAVGWFCVTLSPYVELWFFDGSMRQWLTDQGYTYDQRNAMIVGVAMGFAVIPTIYSIAEDAVFNVPKHLTQGSAALGATPWQTLTRVVLLTASPGIFSALMIGLGRAVGETMIVLMATGNSPVVNFNIFEGMRTLSANIAVEMPETEVGGTHFRILFLAALVLFILTFLLNTAAEIVRQRLRKKYSSL